MVAAVRRDCEGCGVGVKPIGMQEDFFFSTWYRGPCLRVYASQPCHTSVAPGQEEDGTTLSSLYCMHVTRQGQSMSSTSRRHAWEGNRHRMVARAGAHLESDLIAGRVRNASDCRRQLV